MPDRFLAARPSGARLDMVEQELQDFCYMVSHDLAASFRRLSAFSHLLLGEFGPDLSHRQHTYADQIQTANTRCQLMMEQLLVYSRAQQRLLEPVVMDATLSMRLAMLQLVRDRQPVQADVQMHPLGLVYADPDLLGLMFRHLLSNASKFRRPGEPHTVAISSVRDPTYWRLRVADTGRGVDPEYREQAFQMFRRLDPDEAVPGVGAGLAICRRVAHRHGGEVEFLDCEGGACIELRLPFAELSPDANNGSQQLMLVGFANDERLIGANQTA